MAGFVCRSGNLPCLKRDQATAAAQQIIIDRQNHEIMALKAEIERLKNAVRRAAQALIDQEQKKP